MGAGVRKGAMLGAAVLALVACSSAESTVLVRPADEVQVLSPDEVAAPASDGHDHTGAVDDHRGRSLTAGLPSTERADDDGRVR